MVAFEALVVVDVVQWLCVKLFLRGEEPQREADVLPLLVFIVVIVACLNRGLQLFLEATIFFTSKCCVVKHCIPIQLYVR